MTGNNISNLDKEVSIFDLVESGIKLTPMMEQYFQIKKNYRDTLLLFRMGDFYEVFFDDAKTASKILNIALTHRGKIDNYPIPMAGIPHHAANAYIDKITSLGLKAAICEQIEDPKDAVGIVKRAVTQVVSPGMPYDLEKLTSLDNKFIACATIDENKQFYLCLIDFTTGDFVGIICKDEEDLVEQLKLYGPKEFVSSLGRWDNFNKINEFISSEKILLTNITEEYFQEKFSSEYIKKLIPSYKRDQIIKLHQPILSVIGAISYYICSTQSLEKVDHLKPFKLQNRDEYLKITYPTLVGLEIFPKSRENYQASLLGFIDKTKTAMGGRLLKQFFTRPLMNIQELNTRYDAIEYFGDNLAPLQKLREELTLIRDLDRLMAKIGTNKANGGDLLNLAHALQFSLNIPKIFQKLPNIFQINLPSKKIAEISTMATLIKNTINDEIGANLDKGNMIKSGANKERDRLAKIAFNAAEELLKLEQKYREKTGITNLKIKSNNITGYFIEVSKSHLSKVPKSFERRQTLVNAERFLSPELEALEKEIVTAKDKLLKLERKIVEDIIFQIIEHAQDINLLSQNIALIDVISSFAWLNLQENFTRPVLEKNLKLLEVEGAFHPLIKNNIKDHFVSHHLKLDDKIFFGLITGPNMAGKTTVMREMAIIQLLAQIGCFVPAAKVKLSICDFIFSRLGASDDIIKGQSTFMVEMTETAEIIRHATERSLIVLDEIGRGTSTYDGMSIAWALVEYFVKDIKAKTLFSTHYHELIELIDTLPEAKNLTVRTEKIGNKIQFMYELIEKGATQSFGINVAELAGIPKKVLKRSREILSKIEHAGESLNLIEHIQGKNMIDNQLNFFSSPIHENHVEETNEAQDEIKKEIAELDLFNMTPIQALNKLNEIQKLARQ